MFYINGEYFQIHFRHLANNEVTWICSAKIFKDFWRYSLLVIIYSTHTQKKKKVIKEPFIRHYCYIFNFKSWWEVDFKKTIYKTIEEELSPNFRYAKVEFDHRILLVKRKKGALPEGDASWPVLGQNKSLAVCMRVCHSQLKSKFSCLT